MLTVAHILAALTGHTPQGPTTVITDAVIDSREARSGALFVAIPGSRVDGHDYVSDAFANGAVAALVHREMGDLPTLDLREPPTAEALAAVKLPVCLHVDDTVTALQQIARYWRRQLPDLTVVGITGSVGKTTTKEIVTAVLRQRFNTVKSRGNYNNEIGLPLSMLRITPQTEFAVLEMGFYLPGEIAFLAEIAQPHMGVVTNVYHVHLERAGSVENIIRGKGELIEALPPAPRGVAILNHDEPAVMSMRERNRLARLMSYGLSPEATLWADQVEGLGLNGIRFRLHHRHETLHVSAPILGRHSVHTVLRAVAVGLTAGMAWQDIITGLQSAEAQQHIRLAAVQGPNGSLFIDDTYNASPESTIAALDLLADIRADRRIAVLGDMLELGAYEQLGHQRVGSRARGVADVLITVGDRATVIADEARRAGMPPAHIHQFSDSEPARSLLLSMVRAGDVVLVKGSRATRLDALVAALEVA